MFQERIVLLRIYYYATPNIKKIVFIKIDSIDRIIKSISKLNFETNVKYTVNQLFNIFI